MWWRYAVGMVSGVALAAGGILWWKNTAVAEHILPRAPLARLVAPSTETGDDDAPPPQASEKTREQKRFDRYDKDRDGRITREEYLVARRKAFAKLDTNGDGRLSFDEWAAKAETKFATADADRSGALTAAEFLTTKVQRKPRAVTKCPPADRKDDGGEA